MTTATKAEAQATAILRGLEGQATLPWALVGCRRSVAAKVNEAARSYATACFEAEMLDATEAWDRCALAFARGQRIPSVWVLTEAVRGLASLIDQYEAAELSAPEG